MRVEQTREWDVPRDPWDARVVAVASPGEAEAPVCAPRRTRAGCSRLSPSLSPWFSIISPCLVRSPVRPPFLLRPLDPGPRRNGRRHSGPGLPLRRAGSPSLAAFFGVGAAGVEVAARGRIRWVLHVSTEYDAPSAVPEARVGLGYGREEGFGTGRCLARRRSPLVSLAASSDQLPDVHHSHPGPLHRCAPLTERSWEMKR